MGFEVPSRIGLGGGCYACYVKNENSKSPIFNFFQRNRISNCV
jgi:hypothetical protein